MLRKTCKNIWAADLLMTQLLCSVLEVKAGTRLFGCAGAKEGNTSRKADTCHNTVIWPLPQALLAPATTQ